MNGDPYNSYYRAPLELIDWEPQAEEITLESQPARAPIVNQGASVGGEGLPGSAPNERPNRPNPIGA